MKQEKLWSFDFINYGMSSSVYYMTQYILVTALPIIIISELNGMAYSYSVGFMVRPLPWSPLFYRH